MAYPQPNSNAYCTGGYPFFRLQTPLVSAGDIYESEQSALAFALGPESDVSRVTINYFDDQLPTRMNAVDISQDRLLSGKIYARNDALYLPAQRKSRILIGIDDLYDPQWRPVGFDVNNDTIEFVSPILDVLQYFSAPPNVAPQRADKRYLFQDYKFIPGGNFYIVLPYWGRRYAYVQAKNPEIIVSPTFTLFGLNYAIADDSNPSFAGRKHQVTTLSGPTALAPGGGMLSPPAIVTAGQHGMFDALVIELNSEIMILKIVLSDVEES